MTNENQKFLKRKIFNEYKYGIRTRMYNVDASKNEFLFAVKDMCFSQKNITLGDVSEQLDNFIQIYSLDLIEFVVDYLKEKNNQNQ